MQEIDTSSQLIDSTSTANTWYIGVFDSRNGFEQNKTIADETEPLFLLNKIEFDATSGDPVKITWARGNDKDPGYNQKWSERLSVTYT